ncbi:MAG TPA: nitroreductase family deazaflavin-dependent oxidoreductase [Anaerolineales bacterium]|nr:nitroreductase family deazaflavin-dependent oxidoreductase [Anaerolineales bacterium]
MGRAFFRFANAIHVFLYRRTRGRLGGEVQGLRVLLLSTIGRRTGKARVAPLGYFEHEGSYVIIASNAGLDRNPGWFHNLKSQLRATIEIGEKNMPVEAKVIGPDVYSQLWGRLVALSPGYAGYAKRTKRKIPLVALRPR